MVTKAPSIFLKILLPLLLSVGGVSVASAAPALRCESVFAESTRMAARLQIIEQAPHLELSELLFNFKKDGKLIYQGKHKYEPGTEFLASNEYDWLSTPFDHKPADVLVAFGTNSAWEIAVNKKVKSLYIADWSPYPLLASAYIVSPLIKIAKTPQEFIILLSGQIPTKALTERPLDDIFNDSTRFAANPTAEKHAQVKTFLEYLAQQKISDFELKFLTSYFYGLTDPARSATALGPFSNLRYASYAKILNFFDQRYSPTVVEMQNPQTNRTVTLEQASAFSSQENFNTLRNLFATDNVHYGLTSITDLSFYKSVQKIEARLGYGKYALSITNIFDCGDYNGLTHKDLQTYLRGTMDIFAANKDNPLVVFRTTNTQPPHGFLRYDLTQKKQVLELKDDQDLAHAN